MKIKKQLIRASASISCFALGRTVSRFLFYSAIYLLDLPPGKERAALLSLRTLRYTWSFWSWCRHHYMSPYNVVSSYLAVSPLPCGGLFSVTAFIRLLPSVLSTAGCPCQSGLSSGVSPATDRSTLFRWFHLLHFYCENVTGGMFSMGTCYTFVVKT